MSTNPYITGTKSAIEQSLLNDLHREVIKFNGIDCVFAPRTNVNIDQLYGEDVVSKFETAYEIEMYFETVDGYGGTDIISRFGLEIPDTATLVMHRQEFQLTTGLTAPVQGDLIYIPVTKALFEVKFVEDEVPFFTLGSNYSWKMEVELFQYSQEQLDTGVVGIDRVEDTLTNPDDSINDPFADNDDIIEEGNAFIDFSSDNPFSERF